MAETDLWAIVEEWRPVVGFETLYEVSSRGRVRRIGKAHKSGNGYGGGARIGRVLKTPIGKDGYCRALLWSGGKQCGLLVHRLVSTAFIGPCPTGKEVNHINGQKQDNGQENLEYLTRGENNQHAYRIGLRTSSTEAAQVARRKPRTFINCGCGCGGAIETPDRKGRERHFIQGHNLTRRVQ